MAVPVVVLNDGLQPIPVSDGRPPAKITDRFIAYVLDTVPFIVGHYVSLGLAFSRWSVPVHRPDVRAGFFLAWLGAYLLYHLAGNMAGATLGKALLGARVVRRSGERVGFARALTRSLGLLASTPLFNLGFLWAFVDADSRTWHDLLSGCRVVEARPRTFRQSFGTALLAFALLAALLAGALWPRRAGPTPAEREAVENARQGLRVLAAVEELHRAERGAYTDRLIDLAVASGDVEKFRQGMRELFDSRGLVMTADRDHYAISARAKDRRRTVVTLSGP